MTTHTPLELAVISLFPEMFTALDSGIPGRALKKKLLNISHFNTRDYADPPHYRVDDRPYGGGPGMVMCYEPMSKAILDAKSKLPDNSPVIHLSPQGEPLTQSIVNELATLPSLILVTSRYEGIDERIKNQHIDREISIGDFVVSGGEIPAMLLIDSIIRQLPGALGDEESAIQDSFSNGLLDHPHYTRPANVAGMSVPQVLLSGDHRAIQEWRHQESLKNTWQNRPDLIKRHSLTDYEQAFLNGLSSKKAQP